MSETPPPPPAGGDAEPPTTPYPQQPGQQPADQGWQPSWQPSGSTPGQAPYDQPVYNQPVYGQQPNPQVPYGNAQGPAYGAFAPDHPQATTVLILGILGLVLCQVLSPIAWVMGNRVVREIDASGGTVGGRSSANAGRICGMIGTFLIGLGLLVVVAVIVVAIIGASSA